MGLFDSITKIGSFGLIPGNAMNGANAANNAADAQQRYLNDSLDFTKSTYKDSQARYEPYLDAGKTALASYLAMTGLSGQDLQNAEIDKIRESGLFKNSLRDNQEGMLSNAAVSGRLRSGDASTLFAQIEPRLINDFLQSRINSVSPIVTLGQSSASNSASLTPGLTSAVSGINSSLGTNRAYNEMIPQQYANSAMNGIFDFAGKMFGMGVG